MARVTPMPMPAFCPDVRQLSTFLLYWAGDPLPCELASPGWGVAAEVEVANVDVGVKEVASVVVGVEVCVRELCEEVVIVLAELIPSEITVPACVVPVDTGDIAGDALVIKEPPSATTVWPFISKETLLNDSMLLVTEPPLAIEGPMSSELDPSSRRA